MNWPLTIALAALAKPLCESLVYIYRLIFTRGKKEQMTLSQAKEFLAKVDDLKREFRRVSDRNICDVQDIYEAMSAHNDVSNERFDEFYKEFVALRVRFAAYSGDPNGDTN